MIHGITRNNIKTTKNTYNDISNNRMYKSDGYVNRKIHRRLIPFSPMPSEIPLRDQAANF